MQRIVIDAWCDICEATTNEKKMDTETDLEFVYDGTQYAIDLCESHADPRWSELMEYATDLGPAKRSYKSKQVPATAIPKPRTTVKRVTSTDARQHECKVCHDKFQKPQGLAAHASVHKDWPPEKITCPQCGYKAKTPVGLSAHVRAHERAAV